MMAISMRLHLPAIILGLLIGCGVITLLMRLLAAKHVRLLGLLVLLSCLALAFALPELHRAGESFVGRFFDIL